MPALDEESTSYPTAEFLEKHEIIRRDVKGGGNRRLPKHEALLRADKISAEAWDAGVRWVLDYLVGIIGKSRCSLDTSVRSSGDDGSDHRHEAAGRHMAAVRYLDSDAEARKACGHIRPSSFVTEALVHDKSYAWLGGEMGIDREEATRALQRCLDVLATHYAIADRAQHRSSTPGTKAVALKRAEPDQEET
jgi:hypothetical protein